MNFIEKYFEYRKFIKSRVIPGETLEEKIQYLSIVLEVEINLEASKLAGYISDKRSLVECLVCRKMMSPGISVDMECGHSMHCNHDISSLIECPICQKVLVRSGKQITDENIKQANINIEQKWRVAFLENK